MAFTSHSLSGVWAAVAAGLGITVRTGIGLPQQLRSINDANGKLPNLPLVGLSLVRNNAELEPAAQHLREIILQAVQQTMSAQ